MRELRENTTLPFANAKSRSASARVNCNRAAQESGSDTDERVATR